MAASDILKAIFGISDRRAAKPDADGGSLQVSNPYGVYSNYIKPPYERRRRYDIYDEMDEYDIISSVLDAYSEDATQTDRERKAIVWVTARKQQVRELIEGLFQRLRVEEMASAITRDVAKYGDDFAQLFYKEGEGILGWDWRDPREVERVETKNGVLVGYEDTSKLGEVRTAIERGDTNVTLSYKPWDIVHFRLYRRKREPRQKFRNIYGTSLLAGSERIAKQVKIVEDMLMVHRLTKTLDTRIYSVDVANASVEEEIKQIKRWKNALKRKPYTDPAAGRYDSLFDPFSWQEDLFWPVRENSKSEVSVMQGQPNVADVADVDLMINKLFGSLRAPKGYFGFEGDIEARATLSAQDIKWGRAANLLQKAVKNGLTRLAHIELALHGIDPRNESFEVDMVVPSVLEDLSRLEAVQTMVDIADRLASLGETLNLAEGPWRERILRYVLGFSEEEVELFAPSEEPSEPGEPRKEPESKEPVAIDEAAMSLICSKLGLPTLKPSVTEVARANELPLKEFTLPSDCTFLPVGAAPDLPEEPADEAADGQE